MHEKIPAYLALDILADKRAGALDVRSEGEFAEAAIPGFANVPILNDHERHQVGLTYKQAGQDAAIALGQQLVAPSRVQRVRAWEELGATTSSNSILVTCWRGGLRSKIACDWLAEIGRATIQVEGGYKAMRHELLPLLSTPPPLIVLSGLTGSGKTKLIHSLKVKQKIDLEGLAHHRGSTFGEILNQNQPTQATFENALAMGLRKPWGPVLLEDESIAIGRLYLPMTLREKMIATPVVSLVVSLPERVENIFDEYIKQPLQDGISLSLLANSLVTNIRKLERRLGGAMTAKVGRLMAEAFTEQPTDLERHSSWIELLLTEYYDKCYRHAFERHKRQLAFRGNRKECEQWILAQYA